MLTVRLTPKSARDGIEGVLVRADGPVLAARVRAVPDKGKANAALEKLVARWLGLPKSCVGLAGGGKSRVKSIAVKGDPGRLAALLEDRLAGLS